LAAQAATATHAARLCIFSDQSTGHDYASQRNDPGFPE
jgi:hypothetical protein